MMIVEASITGVFRTILLLIGGIVVLRFFGQLAIARRNMEEERKMNQDKRVAEKERAQKLRNFGRTTILKGKPVEQQEQKTSGNSSFSDAEDIDFEEIID